MNLYDVFPFDAADVDLKEALSLLNDLSLPVGHRRRRLPAQDMMDDALRLIDRAVDGLTRFGTDIVDAGEDSTAAHGLAFCSAPSCIDADALTAAQALSAARMALRELWERSGSSVLPAGAISAIESVFPGPFKDRLDIEQSALDAF